MMKTIPGYVIVFLGAGLGGMLRHAANRLQPPLATFPWSTLAVNVVGCTIMGVVAGWFAFRGEASQHWRLFFATGILGGFTTFSAFALDAVLLTERGKVWSAAWYVGASIVVSIAGVFTGLAILRRWT
jgi:CrcB protein